MGWDNKKSKRLKVEIILTFTICILVSLLMGNQLFRFEYLPFISYHHLASSREIIKTQNMIEYNVEYNKALKFNYAPNSYLITSIFSLVSGLDLEMIYVVLPIIFLFFFLIFLYLTSRELNAGYLIILGILILSTSVLTTFFSINYPHTLSLLFLTSILLLTIKNRKDGNSLNLILLGFFFGASIISHLNPAIFGFLIIIFFLFFLSRDFKGRIKIFSIIFLGAVPFIFIYPFRIIIKSILFIQDSEAERTAMEWVNNQIAWSPNYSLEYYLTFILGFLLILLFFLSFLYILKKTYKKKFLLIFYPPFFIFILAIIDGGLFFYKMLPSVLILLFIPLCLFFKNKNFTSKKILLFSLLLILILSVITFSERISSLGGGYSTDLEIYHAMDWIRENTEQNSIFVTNIGFEGLIVGLGERNQFGGGSTPYTITKLLNPQENYHQIVKSQKESSIDLLCSKEVREKLIIEYNISYFIYSRIPTYLDIECNNLNLEQSFSNFPKVFTSEKGNVIIYKIKDF